MAARAATATRATDTIARPHAGQGSDKGPNGREFIVAVRVAGETYGIPVALVHEIVRPCEAMEIPNSPAHVRGALRLFGSLVPVLDLRRRLGLPPADEAAECGARIVIVEQERDLVGLLVDAVLQVGRLPASRRRPLGGAERAGAGSDLALDVIRVGRELITLLDVSKAARLDRTVTEYVERAQARSAA